MWDISVFWGTKKEWRKERQLCKLVTFCLTSKEDFSLLKVIHLCTCYGISIVSKLIACTGKERMASWLLYGYFTKLMRQQMIFNPIKKTKHSLFSPLLKKNPTFLALGLDDMILQFRESGNYRTSAMKLVFCGKLMNHLLPMTGRKSTCLCPYVMNFYEVKFAVYKKYTFSCCRCKIIGFRI